MTALERQLGKTFRAARWAATAGKPSCPACFDGMDLAAPLPDPLTPGLSRYRCKVCRVDFSDVKGTVFATIKPVSIAFWAYLVLYGDPGRIEGLSEHELRRAWELSSKIKLRWSLAAAWRYELSKTRVTGERLAMHLTKHRRTA